jgi:hypothetical protein
MWLRKVSRVISNRTIDEQPRTVKPHPEPILSDVHFIFSNQTSKTRIWQDSSGQFQVEAEFKGKENGEILLLKRNGVTISVPLERLSKEDRAYVAKMTAADDQPDSRPETENGEEASVTIGQRKPIDWFNFFREAHCSLDNSIIYASVFEREQVNRSALAYMETHALRGFGLREEDALRVMKLIKSRDWASGVNAGEHTPESAPINLPAIMTGPTSINLDQSSNVPPSSPSDVTYEGFEHHDTLRRNSRRGRPTHSKKASLDDSLQLAVSKLVVSQLDTKSDALDLPASYFGPPFTPTATTSSTHFVQDQLPSPFHHHPAYIPYDMLETTDTLIEKSQEGGRTYSAHSKTSNSNDNLQLSASKLDDSLHAFDSLVSHLISPSTTITTQAEVSSTNGKVTSSPAWVSSPNQIDFDPNPALKSINIFDDDVWFPLPTGPSVTMTGGFRPIL